MTSPKMMEAVARMRRGDGSRRRSAKTAEAIEQPKKSKQQLREEADKAAREFRAAHPLEVVPLRLAERSQHRPTLRAAHELILEHGGQVDAGEHGTLVFLLPARLAEGVAEQNLRAKLERACELLDACRPAVRAALVAGEELPAAQPALGGGVVS